jgi:hypothetical protein
MSKESKESKAQIPTIADTANDINVKDGESVHYGLKKAAIAGDSAIRSS